MKARTIGLRAACILFGLVGLVLIARLWARSEIVIGGTHLGRIPSSFLIAASGGLSIWLSKLAGPWRAEAPGEPLAKR